MTSLPTPLRHNLPELAILAVAALTRFWRLDHHSFWFDEAVSLSWAATDMDYTWRVTFQLMEEKHPPIYYLSLHLWQQMLDLVGLAHNEAALRAWGSLLGVLTVIGVMRLASAAGSPNIGRLAGLLTALSPLLVWYSQELRMFQPATTGIVWFAVAIWSAWHTEHPGRRLAWWTLAVVAQLSALYSYLFSAFVLPSGGLMLFALLIATRNYRRFAEGCLAFLLIALLFLPLALNAWGVNATEGTPGRAFSDFLPNLLRVLRNATIWRADWPETWVAAALIGFALLALLGLLMPRHTPTPDEQTDDAAGAWQTGNPLWLWLWFGVPLLVANLLLTRNRSIFNEDRYLLFLAPFGLWAIARGIGTLSRIRRMVALEAAALAVLAIAVALPALWLPANLREDWRAAARYIQQYEQAAPGLPGAVVTHVDYTHQALGWYLRTQAQTDIPIFHPFGEALTTDDVETRVAPPLLGLTDFGAATVWLTQSHLEGVDDQRLVEGWLTARYPLVTEQYPTGIKLTGYMLRARFAAVPTLSPNAVVPNTELAPGLRLAACEVITPVVAARDEFMHPPSGWVHVRLWWQPTASLGDDYVATAQVIGPEGVWGDRLHRPTEALRLHPTSTWTTGDFYRDELDINLNPLTPPNTYPVVIGVMDGQGNPTGDTVVECGRVQIR